MDESNNISVTKNLMLHTQFVDCDTNSLVVKFMKTIPLVACDTRAIIRAICEYYFSNGMVYK